MRSRQEKAGQTSTNRFPVACMPESSDMLLYRARVNEYAVLRIAGKQAMERSTFSEDNSVPFRIGSSLLSNLMLLYEP
jgi:hypothetical protein